MTRLVASALLLGLVMAPWSGAATPRPPSPATLLARHVPILVLHPEEQLVPVSVDGFLADADVQRRTEAGWETVSAISSGVADLRLDQRLCHAADGPAATPCYAQAQAAHAGPAVVYGAAFRRGNRIELQYWIWYPFNPYSPTVPAGELWQVHEGDWEAVSVITQLRGTPLLAGYSQHDAGRRRAWARVPKQGSHPVAYVAVGSHANYFAPGIQRFDPRVVEPLLISLIEQAGLPPVDHTGRGRIVRPRLVRVSATSPTWMAFAGRWGEDQYVRAPGGVPQLFGGAPRGPAFQEHWRRPVADVLSWPQG